MIFFQSNKDVVLPTKIEVKPAPLLQKTRKLPAWLIQASNVDIKSTENNARARKGKAGAANAAKKVKPSTPGKHSVLVLLQEVLTYLLFKCQRKLWKCTFSCPEVLVNGVFSLAYCFTETTRE